MDYTLILTDNDLQVIGIALGELPFKVSSPLVDKLNKQIEKQRSVEKK